MRERFAKLATRSTPGTLAIDRETVDVGELAAQCQ